jgi:hypothetical protein
MSDGIFKFSLILLFWLLLALVIAAIALGAAGMPWLDAELPVLVLITLFAGLLMLVLGGGALIYIWGKRYVSKG